jgi:hypothetical protein
MKPGTALLLLANAGPALFAHEVVTHQRIGDAAVAYLYAAYQNATPSRPLLLGSVAQLQPRLQTGAVQEDNAGPYGRYLFHFTPAMDFLFKGTNQNEYDLISANGCSSVNWGQSTGPSNGATGCNASCSLPPSGVLPLLVLTELNYFCSRASGLHSNSFRWDQNLNPDNTGMPSATSVQGFGYVVHLLEDLGSPAHTRNDAHPCVNGSYCDQFEKFNDNSIYAPFGDPQLLPGNVWSNFVTSTIPTPGVINRVISTAGFTSVADFFNALQSYVSANYYSNRTVLQGVRPAIQFSAGDYFYGSCITSSGVAVSQIAGTCRPVLNPADGHTYMVRKIAHKPMTYWASCPNPVNAVLGLSSEAGCDVTKADIDQTIAREQFAELGPVIAQHVAAFIQFYAPALTVQIQGNGTVTSSPGNGINCSNGTCQSLFVQGAQIILTAQPGSGAMVTWGGDCLFAGSNTTVQLLLTADKTCTANFTSSATSGSPTAAIDQVRCSTVPFANGSAVEFYVSGTIQGPPNSGLFLSVRSLPTLASFSSGACGGTNNIGSCAYNWCLTLPGPGVTNTEWFCLPNNSLPNGTPVLISPSPVTGMIVDLYTFTNNGLTITKTATKTCP